MTLDDDQETCADCGAVLRLGDGDLPVHRYIGASPSCWQLFSALTGADTPPLAPRPLNGLILDAYCVQHHGTPSPQATQSVAVHLLVLHAVLGRGWSPSRALFVRTRATRPTKAGRIRFSELTPPDRDACPTVAWVVEGVSPDERGDRAERYVRSVYAAWAALHAPLVEEWFRAYIDDDG